MASLADVAADTALAELLLQLQSYTRQYEALCTNMQHGLLNLSSARLALGSKKLSKYSFPFRITPLTTLVPSAADATRLRLQSPLLPATAPAPDTASTTAAPTDAGASASAGAGADAAATAPTTRVAGSPLKWFGYVLPATLRASQRHFVAATDAAVQAAQLAVRIRELTAKLEAALPPAAEP